MIHTDPEKTVVQFDNIVSRCKKLFENKIGHYKPAIEILSVKSVTEHMYTIAWGARQMEEEKIEFVKNDYEIQFYQLINYSIIALLQLDRSTKYVLLLTDVLFIKEHQDHLQNAKELMIRKNHDYSEAWRQMRISSLTDLVLTKLLRIKQIQQNGGSTIASEGVDANYYDIINYCIFALIRLETKN
jgi:hypothetical protein